ncbi:MAG: hypothetical protein OXN93_10605, partial [bacterium]|nr:hypothetical protein [bacterium]
MMRGLVAVLVVVSITVPSLGDQGTSDVPGLEAGDHGPGTSSYAAVRGGGAVGLPGDGSPPQVSELQATGVGDRSTGFSVVSAGAAHSCGLRTDGS